MGGGLRPGRRAFYSTIAAFAWSVLLVVAAFTVPIYSGAESAVSSSGSIQSVATSSTLVAVNGQWVLIPIFVPAVITLLVWIALHRKCSRGSNLASFVAWALVGLLAVFCLVAAFTIGVFIVPVAALLAYATFRTPLATA
jgi:hypothetical protein